MRGASAADLGPDGGTTRPMRGASAADLSPNTGTVRRDSGTVQGISNRQVVPWGAVPNLVLVCLPRVSLKVLKVSHFTGIFEGEHQGAVVSRILITNIHETPLIGFFFQPVGKEVFCFF